MNPKYRKPLKIAFYTAISLIMFIDVMHYSYFQELPSVELLGQVSALGVVGDSIAMLLSFKNLLFVVDIPIVIYFVLKKDRKMKFSKKTLKWTSVISLASIILITTTMVNADKLTVLTNQEFFSYHTSDIVNKYFKDEVDKTEKAKQVLSIMEEKDTEVDSGGKHFGIGRDKNLILIQIESLQDFVIDLEYKGQVVTPNINKFIEDNSSLYFDEYYQSIGRGNTSDAEFVTNNSLHPSREEPTYKQYAKNEFYGLPWILRDNGYSAWVFHGYEKEFWNRRQAYVNQGFERFISEEDYDFEEKIIFGISDEEFYEQTLDYLKELDGIDENPFYSFVITLSSHTPYNLDEKYHVLDLEEPIKDTIVGDYLQAIHYADKEFGKFIEGLKKEGLYDDSVIAVYGDHYAIANSDEEVFEPMEELLGEPYNYDHIMNIPLIINVPGMEINETISKVGSQIDFYPTIINIMGLENEKGYMIGMDLINSEEYNYVAPQRVLRRGSFIDEDVIFNVSSDGIFENGKVVDRDTRKEVSLEDYRDVYDGVIEDIGTSDIILANNLFKYLLNEDEDIAELDRDGEQGSQTQKYIESLEEFTINDLDELYNEDDRIIRIYIDEDTDLDKLEKWMKVNPQAKLILNSKKDGTKLLEEVKDEYKELEDRYIAEIDDFNDYFKLHYQGFKNLILDIRDKDYTETEVLDFLNLNSHFAIITEKSAISKDFANKLKEKDIKIYIEKNNKLIEK